MNILKLVLLGSKNTGTKPQDVIATILGLEKLDKLIDYLVQPASFNLPKKILSKKS
jgi:hypothetical protein